MRIQQPDDIHIHGGEATCSRKHEPLCGGPDQCDQKKSPNVYKSCPKMISLEKLKILIPLQKLP